ncbi:MAG: hypothetical protein ACRD2A_17415, partial [Vicinamibacterales bacterium]
MRHTRVLSIALVAALLAACSRPSENAATRPAPGSSGDAVRTAVGSTADRKYLLETIDDAAVVQVYADGFASLPLREKTLI